MDELDEQDLALINALQVAPRISWAQAARVLGSSATTLAERWQRLRDRGIAWVTAHPRLQDVSLAFVEVDCAPGSRLDVVRELCLDPRVVTVEQSARGRDLLLTVLTPDLPALSVFVLDDLPQVRGVQRYRTQLVKAIHRQGGDWRLDALDRQQLAALKFAAARPRTPVSAPAGAWPLIEALAVDGRRSAADLARLTGRKPATVRRQLSRLIASGALSFRCEVAQMQSRWPITGTWLARVPSAEHARTAAILARIPELRLCVSTTGDTNLMLTVWTRSLPDLLKLEHLLGEQLPRLSLIESQITLRTVKRMGWVLDAEGRSTGEVVVSSALKSRTQGRAAGRPVWQGERRDR
jgi:DNA-binding Lrp family transcriptional regulator